MIFLAFGYYGTIHIALIEIHWCSKLLINLYKCYSGANLDLKTHRGETALTRARSRRNEYIVQLLEAAGDIKKITLTIFFATQF